MVYVPDQGDIVLIDFDPSSGKEIMKTRPAFVISRKMFNEHTSMAVVAPITSTIRNVKIEVILPESTQTKGSILVYQLKSLDFEARNVRLIEKAPQKIIEKVISIAQLITQ
ncbi:type II toxin-antitoxin system PemK/MazF family toxin [Zooshikella sp. RANM57]|uniref:type II toxin-antitoxin system PemK/MazF family toxin n=1 Tax=Zooshikella sp. RANM57 TaxID=3425863 RepID=UPI003D6F49AA